MTGECTESSGIQPIERSSSKFLSADTYPRPGFTRISTASVEPAPSVAMCASGSRISTSGSGVMCLAFTSPGSDVRSISVFGWSTCILSGTRLRFRMRSVVSSIAPGIGENSCRTPSTRTAVTAAPSIHERRTRRSALPTVVAKPRSNGWA